MELRYNLISSISLLRNYSSMFEWCQLPLYLIYKHLQLCYNSVISLFIWPKNPTSPVFLSSLFIHFSPINIFHFISNTYLNPWLDNSSGIYIMRNTSNTTVLFSKYSNNLKRLSKSVNVYLTSYSEASNDEIFLQSSTKTFNLNFAFCITANDTLQWLEVSFAGLLHCFYYPRASQFV